MKTCTKCKEAKPLAEFGKAAKGRDGLKGQCKACLKIAKAVYRADPANREKEKASTAEWSKANKWKRNAITAKYNAANPVKAKARKVKWNSDNPDKTRATRRIGGHNRRARKRENGGKLSPGLTDKLFTHQRGKCPCCGLPLGKDYHLDHCMPLALGGTNTDDNMQLLRAKCNMQKHTAHPVAFMQSRGFLL